MACSGVESICPGRLPIGRLEARRRSVLCTCSRVAVHEAELLRDSVDLVNVRPFSAGFARAVAAISARVALSGGDWRSRECICVRSWWLVHGVVGRECRWWLSS